VLVSILATLPAAAAGVSVARLAAVGLVAQAALSLLAFGVVYGVIVWAAGHPEARRLLRRRAPGKSHP